MQKYGGAVVKSRSRQSHAKASEAFRCPLTALFARSPGSQQAYRHVHLAAIHEAQYFIGWPRGAVVSFAFRCDFSLEREEGALLSGLPMASEM